MSKLIEIHSIQNHAPSNLNRDESGSPKEAVFGGVKRARISSQCLKRTIRRSDQFQAALEGNVVSPFESALAMRTRQLPDIIRKRFVEAGFSQEVADYAALKASGVANAKETPAKPSKSGSLLTAQTILLSNRDIDAVFDALKETAEGKSLEEFKKVFDAKKKKRVKSSTVEDEEESDGEGVKLQKMIAEKGYRPITVDIALFGRMVTSQAFRDVEACCQVAHPLSTHKIAHEFDYFTAVDDLQGIDETEGEEDSGADMIGDVEFNSACYYKYLSIDLDGLVDNLMGKGIRDSIPDDELSDATDLAKKAVRAMVEAAVMTTPSGKQNTFAAHQLPAAVLIEVRPVKTPISYANAFVDPVRTGKDGKDLVTGSLDAFKEHVEALTEGFNLKADRRLLLAPLHKTWSGIEGTERVKSLNDLLSALEKAL